MFSRHPGLYSNNVENEKIRQLEEEMLKNPVIKDYCYTGHGINSLIELLVNIQKEKLLNFVPKLKKAIKDKLREYNTILDNLPKGCRNRKEFNK